MAVLQSRREATERRISELRGSLLGAARRADGRACVYATGSFGRGEASDYSDLDLFIVGKDSAGETESSKPAKSELRRLDEICIKAELIEATAKLNIPEFSGDAEYLAHYSVSELIKALGTRQDDVSNTFTARLLLLLESRPLVGEVVYDEIVSDVVSAYWRDYMDHKNNFMPAFLTNDILRLWRTFCVNYEARTDREPEPKKIKGKIKNYKLKHSRMLTCYSAILYLLNDYAQNGTVSPDTAIAMARLTPTSRLEFLSANPNCARAHVAIAKILERYENFLETTGAPEDELYRAFANRDESQRYGRQASEFGGSVAEALAALGEGSGAQFYRLLLV